MSSIYYSGKREEMLQYIPDTCKTILEIGCGEGVFAKSVKIKFNAEVWGVELKKEVAEKAEKVIDKVICGDITNIVETLPANYFDCIIFNDVLEHLLDPFDLLKNLKLTLKNGGYIVSSIPNVRYIWNLIELIHLKDWRYKDEGLLDITHLRFFTKKSIIRMFNDAGYEIIQVNGINPTTHYKVKILEWITFGYLSDTKFSQIATTARLIK